MELIQKIDLKIIYFIQDNLHNTFFDKFFLTTTHLGDYGAIWVVMATIFMISRKYRKYGLMIFLALFLFAILSSLIFKPVFGRIRPCNMFPNIPLLLPRPDDFSFPSGHSMSSFAAATVIYHLNAKLGAYAYILAALIAFSRVYLFVHYPSDVIGGAIFGIGCGLLAIWGYGMLVSPERFYMTRFLRK